MGASQILPVVRSTLQSKSVEELRKDIFVYPYRANYTTWAIRMQVILEAIGLWEMIEPKLTTEADTKKDKTAIAYIYQSLPEEQLLLISKYKTANEVWDALKTRHVGENRVQQAKQQTLKSEFEMLQMEENESIDSFVTRLTGIINKAASVGLAYEDSTLVRKLFNAVPDRFLQIVASIEQYSDLDTMSLDEAIGRLKTFEERLKYKNERPVNTQERLFENLDGGVTESMSRPGIKEDIYAARTPVGRQSVGSITNQKHDQSGFMIDHNKKVEVTKSNDQPGLKEDHNCKGSCGCWRIWFGKTTQIPQYLHEAGYSKAGKIGCTQPRETAAICAAERVSHEMGATLGLEVGYSTQSQDCTSPGTLLQCPMVEDAHETLLSTQILLSILKGIASSRPEFKLLITSAAWEARKISDYFDFAPVFKIPGRIFPVEINYTKKPNPDYLENAVDTVLMIHVSQPRGDGGILVFLPGYEEIKAAERIFIKRTRGGLGSRVAELLVCPLYEDLPPNFNSKIFEPTLKGAHKVVLATSIVETLVAINGIKYVIDTGFVQRKAYHPHTGLESLVITHISKASAYLRARQSGQTGSGKCFRLYTEDEFNGLEDNTVLDIQRTQLANVVLTLKSLGFHDLKNFDFIDPPRVDALEKTQELLLALGALDTDGALTLVGKKMIEFPLGPLLSRMIVASDKYKCSEEIITIAATLSIGASVFCNPKVNENNARFYQGDDGGDHIALLEFVEGIELLYFVVL
nr:pre-mRNA-splicing factor ATP-dependent RNA helicase DEAH1-like isoform X1 [Tanacetum cinerariifolium]